MEKNDSTNHECQSEQQICIIDGNNVSCEKNWNHIPSTSSPHGRVAVQQTIQTIILFLRNVKCFKSVS